MKPAAIFISYRRDSGTANAGRIADYLRDRLGYSCFYDKYESSNPTGGQFPAHVAEALASCRVVIAVVDALWVSSKDRLRDEKDWVRRELLATAPPCSSLQVPDAAAQRKHLIPICISVDIKKAMEGLPDALGFVPTFNSNFLWTEFEDQQKDALRTKLSQLLPQTLDVQGPSDWPKLELLCDRSLEEDSFRNAAIGGSESNRPSSWLLVGRFDEAPRGLIERIEHFTLRQSPCREKFPLTKVIDLQLEEYLNASEEDIQQRILYRAANELIETGIADYDNLRDRLRKKKVSLAFFFSIVYPKTYQHAKRWIAHFKRISKDLSSASRAGTQIVFALSISFPAPRFTFRFPWTVPDEVLFFEREVLPEIEGAARGALPAFVASRLEPAEEADVLGWRNHDRVRDRVAAVPLEEILKPFETQRELPMEKATMHLRRFLNS